MQGCWVTCATLSWWIFQTYVCLFVCLLDFGSEYTGLLPRRPEIHYVSAGFLFSPKRQLWLSDCSQRD